MENGPKMPEYTLVGRIKSTIAKKSTYQGRLQFLSKETILGSENSRTKKEIGCHPFGSGMGGSEAILQR